MRILFRFLVVLVLLGVAGAGAVFYVLHSYGRNLPDFSQLAAYEPPVVTRVIAADGRLMAEFAVEHRVFVPITAIPQRVIAAFLATEDKNFYQHPGIDVVGIARAAITNVLNAAQSRRLQGASTITQQVAKNFLLTNEVSIERKAKEAILALRIEKALSKERILELYLNEIYLGLGAYGVASAALAYFDKSLDELTIAEAAYLASLPKAPNNYHPVHDAAAAKARRDWAIGRLLEDGVISTAEAEAALDEPLVMVERAPTETVRADYFAEEVRRELAERFGEDGLYGGGYVVRATVDPRLQALADVAMREGLVAYDRRHGWRGPVARIEPGEGWAERLGAVGPPPGLAPWVLAMVLEVGSDARIGFADGTEATIPYEAVKWARPTAKDQTVGSAPGAAGDVLAAGDVVAVEPLTDDEGNVVAGAYALRQIPDVNGGLIALDPHTGRVLAMVGGWSHDDSEFNRAIQAKRQPGSAFKPFVYMAALDAGFTPSTLVEDAPIAIDPGYGQPIWKPANYTGEFYGLSTLRLGIEKSRNLMTVRLARQIGMERVRDMAVRLGVVDDLPPYLPMSLGAGETTLMRMAAAYAAIVNGGKRIAPTLVERIQDRYGRTVYRRDERACPGCVQVPWTGQEEPVLADEREQVLDPVTAYQMVGILEGVVLRGTGADIASLGRPLGGKTGTTDDFKDAWFVGFSPDLVCAIYVGFDQPRTLGKKEAGSRIAVPIFKQFMGEALAATPRTPFRIPPGVRLVKVDAHNGDLPTAATEKVIIEAFRPGTEPGTPGFKAAGRIDEDGGGASVTGGGATITEPSLSGVY
jgi:penicillin-binding protein 1A